jgi:hypothetical protein
MYTNLKQGKLEQNLKIFNIYISLKYFERQRLKWFYHLLRINKMSPAARGDNMQLERIGDIEDYPDTSLLYLDFDLSACYSIIEYFFFLFFFSGWFQYHSKRVAP